MNESYKNVALHRLQIQNILPFQYKLYCIFHCIHHLPKIDLCHEEDEDEEEEEEEREYEEEECVIASSASPDPQDTACGSPFVETRLSLSELKTMDTLPVEQQNTSERERVRGRERERETC